MLLSDIGYVLFLSILFTAIIFVAAAIRSYLVMQRRLKQEALRPFQGPSSSVKDLDFVGARKQRALMDRIDQFGKSILTEGQNAQKQYQLNLMKAGFFSLAAPRNFRLATIASMIVIPLVIAVGIRFYSTPITPLSSAMLIFTGLALGYYAPVLYLRYRTQNLKDQCRAGFPNLLDLLVVSSEAGLSLEASLARVGDEIVASYPFLGQNIRLLIVEMRVGQSLTEALSGLASRIDIPEINNFVSTLQQSREYGTSISDTLRVFSDDMRDRRQMLAEEKAMELPVKLIFPLALFMLPCVFIVALLPVWIQVKGYF